MEIVATQAHEFSLGGFDEIFLILPTREDYVAQLRARPAAGSPQ
jgi:hypothetical protein